MTNKSGIHLKKSTKGSLHSDLGIKQGNHIPLALEEKKLTAAKKAHNVKLERKLQFAINARKFKH